MEIIGKNDPKHVMKRISAFIMSDGFFVKGKGNKNISCRLTTVHKEFAEYFEEVLKPITSVKIIKNNDLTCKQGYFYTAYSPAHPYFTTMKPRFYRNKYRTLDPHALKMLDWEMFAILYQCDGTICKMETGRPSGMTLCTDRLSYGDCLFFADTITAKLGIRVGIKKQGPEKWRLTFYSSDFFKIFSSIKPFISKCFDYKVPNDKILRYYKERYTK